MNDEENRYDPYSSEAWQNGPMDDPTQYGPQKPNAFSTASLVLGLLALLTLLIFYISIPLGALSILFAVLSRRRNGKMAGRARTGVILAAVGMTISVVLTTVSVITFLPYLQSGEFQQYLEQYMEEYLGGNPEGTADTDGTYDIDPFGTYGADPGTGAQDLIPEGGASGTV